MSWQTKPKPCTHNSSPPETFPRALSVSSHHEHTKFPLSSTAALIADPARAAMLTALLNGKAISAGELANGAGISAQSASMHLAQVLQGGFLRVERHGRHRYYRLAGSQIAYAIEPPGSISTPQPYRPSGATQALCYARTRYTILPALWRSALRQHLS